MTLGRALKSSELITNPRPIRFHKSRSMNSAENSIEQVFSIFSHELRTPITSLQGALELLKTYQQIHQQESAAELRGLLGLAADSADRLAYLIETILDWYEIQQGANSFFKQPCNATLLLQQGIAALSSIAVRKQIQISLDAPVQIPIYADQRYLSRILFYLIHNAIKFSLSRSQVQITATLIRAVVPTALLEPPHVLIAIKDQGIGIPEAALNQIFQPFYQVDSSNNRHHGGLGLELAICREVVLRHEGKIYVESQLGQGSTFYVALPTSEQ
jgi:signal transduction histidine kinase